MEIFKKSPYLEQLETKRLYLRLLREDQGRVALDYYERNMDTISYWEPAYEPPFYSVAYQNYLLKCAAELFYDNEGLSLWVYLKEGYSGPIGHLSFTDISGLVYRSCDLGYKLDRDFRGYGYATEMVLYGMNLMYETYEMQRIEALILKENKPSIRLMDRCGFLWEGTTRSYMYLRDKWRDYERYSHIRPDTYPPLYPKNI